MEMDMGHAVHLPSPSLALWPPREPETLTALLAAPYLAAKMNNICVFDGLGMDQISLSNIVKCPVSDQMSSLLTGWIFTGYPARRISRPDIRQYLISNEKLDFTERKKPSYL